MKTLKVIIVLIGFMFSFNNQIFAIDCDFAKYVVKLKEMMATERSRSGLLKDVAIIEEFVSYSVCGDPIKTHYETMKKGLKAIVNLQKYENKLVKGIDIPPPNPCDQVDSTLPSLENATFENLDLRDCKFPKMFLLNSKFINVNLKGQDFSNIMMDDLIFKGSNLENVNFSGTQLYNSIIMNSSLNGAKFNDKTEFMRVRLLNNKIDDDLLREILVWYLYRPEDGACSKFGCTKEGALKGVAQEYEKYLQKNIKTGVILLHRSNLITDKELDTILSTHPYKE